MAKNSIFLINSTHKTKSWWTFVSVLVLVIIPFLIVLLLVGDVNLLEKNWIIAKNASVWHGTISNDIIPDLVRKYQQFTNVDLASVLPGMVGESKSIDAYKMFFNPIVLAPLLGLLVWSIVYPMIFNATKVSSLDVLPFSTAAGIFMFSLIISGLIPQWGQQAIAWYWVVRVVIGFVAAIIFFIIANVLTNKFLLTRDYGFDMFFGYKTQESQNKVVREELKENIKIFKDSDKDYVDIPVEDK